MRFLILILVVALLAAISTYTVLNIEERVDVNLPWTFLRGQPQVYLVLVSLAAGALFTGILSVVDGTRLRLANRRLRRELARFSRDEAREFREDFTPGPGGPTAEPQAAEGPPADRPVVPSAGRSSSSDDDPPYGI